MQLRWVKAVAMVCSMLAMLSGSSNEMVACVTGERTNSFLRGELGDPLIKMMTILQVAPSRVHFLHLVIERGPTSIHFMGHY